jgi:hypothetical protein
MQRAWTVQAHAGGRQYHDAIEVLDWKDLQLHLNDSSSQRSSQIAHIDLPSLFLRMKQWPSTHFVSSLSRTGCTIMCGMIVLAAKVLCAYTLGAYVEAVWPFDRFDVDKLA